MTDRGDAVRVARSAIGTRFQHAGRLPGVGLDCAGLVICVARELGLVAPDFDVPAYVKEPDGSMLKWCGRHMVRVSHEAMQPGDVVVVIADQLPQHMGILGDYRHGGLSIIHASNQPAHMRVLESRLMFWRRMRYVASYSLPGVS